MGTARTLISVRCSKSRRLSFNHAMNRRHIAPLRLGNISLHPTPLSSFINDRRLFSTVHGRGLFGIPELRHPPDFLAAAKQAMLDCDKVRSSLAPSNRVNLSHRTILFRLDQISRILCNVIDAAELCRKVHVQEDWRNAAERTFGILSDYLSQLNGDRPLYEALLHVPMEDDASTNNLSPEERRFCHLLRTEFERDGIHLPDEQREQVRQLQNHVVELETLFGRNLATASSSLLSSHATTGGGNGNDTFVVDAALVRQVLPEHILQYHQIREASNNNNNTNAAQQQQQPQLVLHQSNQLILQTLLRYSTSSALRQTVYLASMTAVPENLAVLAQLRRRRHELAQVLGFASHAHRTLASHMTTNPKNVQEWLKRLLQHNQKAYQQDMALLVQAKQRFEGESSSSSTMDVVGVIEPWDISFYAGLHQASHGFDAQALTPYLSMERTIQGMQHLVQSLFGLEMRYESMAEDERWDCMDGSSNGQQNVQRYSFFNDQNQSLGTMYLDLYPRPGKFGHAAHFTIRCGCVINEESLAAEGDKNQAQYQLPIVALVCNLSETTNVSHSEVVTLLHEFGHALHSLLSRTSFQHMSGTRAAMDFIETPSHLLEHYAWDAAFLKRIAVNDQGQSVPDDMIDQLAASRNDLASLERQNQVLYALFDQQLFGADALDSSSTEIFAQLHKQYQVPYASGTHWHTRFGHLVSYGAGYYSYLYAQVFARDLWQQLFAKDPYSRVSGELLWQKMLGHGGAVDPNEMLTDLLGRPPQASFVDT